MNVRVSSTRHLCGRLGFAIPSDTVMLIAQQIIEKENLPAPIGDSMGGYTPRLADIYGLPVQYGVIVLAIEREAHADQPDYNEMILFKKW
jgi:S1-C subfamily serine protease